MYDLTLTFDNGPTPDVTPGVLDVLAHRKIQATFFVVGMKVAEGDGGRMIERAHDEGHWIGNHTWTHPAPFGEAAELENPHDTEDEIVRTQRLIGPLAHRDNYFRPPGGGGFLDQRLLSPEAVRCMVSQRLTCVLWNAVPRDWAEPEAWVKTALDQCGSRPWTLLVLHDIASGAMRHLARFLDLVVEAGGRFRQDFPPDCMPIVKGRLVGSLNQYMNQQINEAEFQ